MMSDFIKGKKQYDYPLSIQKGIQLHRAIDHFTDQHIATKDAKEVFRPYYRLYSGAFVDIVYDHFLATSSQAFPDFSLQSFCEKTYQQLESNKNYFNPNFSQVFDYMKRDNWLFNYHKFSGIYHGFKGLVRRAKFMDNPEPAFEVFQKEYKTLKICYDTFFPELKQFTLKWIEKNDIVIKIEQ